MEAKELGFCTLLGISHWLQVDLVVCGRGGGGGKPNLPGSCSKVTPAHRGEHLNVIDSAVSSTAIRRWGLLGKEIRRDLGR